MTKKNSKKVTVIMPTYNSNIFFITKAFDSIYSQTFKDFEVIVVDDCSDILFQKTLHDLQVIYKFKLFILPKNSGAASKPINFGI